MLIQGFNTFLPAGYRIECTTDVDNSDLITVTTPMGTTTQAIRDFLPPARDAIPVDVSIAPSQDGDAEADIDRALYYVQRVKNRYANDPEKYKAFLEILSPGELAGVCVTGFLVRLDSYVTPQENVLHRVQRLFKDDPDLIQGFYHFLPDRNLQQRMVARLDEMEDGTPLHLDHKHRGKKQEGASSTPLAKTHPSVPQKRKRKPADKDKEVEKEKQKDVAPKAGPSKVRISSFYVELFRLPTTNSGLNSSIRLAKLLPHPSPNCTPFLLRPYAHMPCHPTIYPSIISTGKVMPQFRRLTTLSHRHIDTMIRSFSIA